MFDAILEGLRREEGILALVFVAALLGSLGAMEIFTVRKRNGELEKALKPIYLGDGAGRNGLAKRASDRLSRTDYGHEIQAQLHAANLGLTPLQWLVIRAGALVILSLLLSKLLSMSFPYNVLIAYPVLSYGAKSWLAARRAKLAQQINRQLPEICRMLASCVRAGMSIQQGMEMVSKELKPPSGPLFKRIAGELKLGTSMDTVLEWLGERSSSQELKLMTRTLAIQRRAGGNVSQALDHLAKTLEDRERVNQELHNKTAESRFIAITLTLMPVFIIMVFNMMFKGFIMPIFTLPGLVLLLLVGVLIGTGLLLIRKVSRVRV